ncbi:MAG: PAS domain S-box protein [Nitrospirae bacterium]|nr:PAS domain S-box protein [Nitrospirota bacterium]
MLRIKPISFKIKLTLLMLGITLALGISIFYIVYVSNAKTLEVQITRRLEGMAQITIDAIDRMLYERFTNISLIASDPIISSRISSPELLTKRLIEYRNVYKTYASLSFFDLNRIRIADTSMMHLGRQHAAVQWSKDAIDNKRVSIASDIRLAEDLKIIVIYFASPVKDKNGNVFGVVVARMPIGKLYDITGKAAGIHGEDTSVDLVDKNGLLLFSGYNRKGILKENFDEWETIEKSMMNKKVGSIRRYSHHMGLKEENITVFANEEGYQDFKGNGWTLIMHIPTAKAFAPAVELRDRVIAVSLPIIIFSIFIVLFFANSVVKPIIQLRDAAAEVGRGNLGIELKIKSRDEIGELTDSFNKMSKSLQETTVSRDYVDNIVRSMAETLIVASLDGAIKTANRSALKLLGYREEELVGKPVNMIFTAEERLFKEYDLNNLIKIDSIRDTEKIYVAKNRRKIPVLFSAAILSDNNGMPQGIVCVAQDITEIKSANERLQKFSNELQRSNKELEQFAYIASHDLQEPLRKIKAFGERLKAKISNALDAQNRDYLERMQNAAERMEGLINGLLTFSRVTTSAQLFVSVDLKKVVQDVISDLEVRLEQTHGCIEADTLPVIDADPLQMRQLFQNLLSNALKFHKKNEPPLVKVYSSLLKGMADKALSNNEFCQIIVEDNGIGFDEKYLDRIFGVFQRLHSRSEYEGTGIGLAVCRKIVERHGGTITAKSSVGQGAMFIVGLPVKQKGGKI